MSRVLHVNTERGWRGGENQVYLLHRGLVRAGIDSTVLCRAGQPLAKRLAGEGLPLATVPEGPLFTARTAWAVRAAAVGGNTIIHAHASAAHGAARIGVSATRAPLVVTRRVDFALKSGPAAHWKYGRRVTRFVAISRAVARVLEEGGVPAARIVLIPSGVEPAPATPAADRAALGVPAGHLLVLCAAALVAHKGHRFLLDAWRRLEDRGVAATLLLAGSGECETELRAQAAGLHHVHFLGWRDDLPALMAACDVAAMASVEEGLGTALIDAQLAGLPVVASAAGGIPEVVADGVSGLLAPPGDAAALAAQLERLLSDADLRAQLATGARRHAQGFLAETMVERYRALYAELLDRTPNAERRTPNA